MESRRVNTELSRITNGNMSSAWAGWEAEGVPDFINRSHLRYAEGAEAPRQAREPIYEIEFRADLTALYNNLTYRDLSVFPSVFRFDGELVAADYDQFHLLGASRFSGLMSPFGKWDGIAWELLKPGGPIVIDSADQFGEYRIQKVTDALNAIIIPSAANPLPSLDGTSGIYIYEEGATFFKVDIGVSSANIGETFVSQNPVCGGLIQGKSGNVITVVPYAFNSFPKATYSGPVPMQAVINSWKVQPRRTVSVYRTLEVALYDLTLSYTLQTAADLDPTKVTIELLNELDEVQTVIHPVPVNGTDVFIDKVIEVGGLVRRMQRFVLESKYPVYGRSRVKFERTVGQTASLSLVNLYRGNHLEKILSAGTEKTDFIESQVDVNSEIVPRGTIIAYAGGAVCPPGYFKAEGVGQVRGVSRLGQGSALCSRFADPRQAIISVELDQRTSGNGVTDPRTIIRLNYGEASRTVVGDSLTFQRSRRRVNVIPFRYDDDNPQAGTLVNARSQIGDPHPEWVTDEYDHVDILPGYILDLSLGDRRYQMIISQYAQGRFIDHLVESGDEGPGTFYPQGRENSDDWRRALRQVDSGMDKNQVFLGYRIYGMRFDPVYFEEAILEVVGDWVDLLNAAMTHQGEADLHVWKSGVLAHAQAHPELGDNNPYGGYGLAAEPHSHFLGKSSDVPILTNLDPGEPDFETPVPLKHQHGWLFGSATLPKVRPVLLCQKI